MRSPRGPASEYTAGTGVMGYWLLAIGYWLILVLAV
jgi:hypothetical protein